MPIWIPSFPVGTPVRHKTSVGSEMLKEKGAKEVGTLQGLGQKQLLPVGLLC